MKISALLLTLVSAFALTACGQKDAASSASASAAPEAAASAAPAAAPAPAPAQAENTVGKGVFGSTCSMCHASGAAGAPKVGDKADWEPRIAQGNDTLYKHATEGFTGSKGQMPARGGNTKLTDDEVKAAVDYMVAQVK